MEHIQKILEAMVGPAMLGIFGACAKYLRDISHDLSEVKTAVVVVKDRLDAHGGRLADHDLRLRELETCQTRDYIS